MTLADLFWLFFMFSALQPVLRQRMLDGMRMHKIAILERKRKSRVILLQTRRRILKWCTPTEIKRTRPYFQRVAT